MVSIALHLDQSKEQIVHDALAAEVWPGEVLLGFAAGRLNPGEFMDKTYYIGLTPRRFLLMRKDQPGKVYSIFRCVMDTVYYAGGSIIRRTGLRMRLGGKTVTLEMDPDWGQRAAQMAEQHANWEMEAPYLTATQFLEGIHDLVDLGLLAPAQALLRQHMAGDPVVEIEPLSAELDRRISEGRWALRLSGGMFIFTLLYIIARSIFWNDQAGPGILSMALLFLSVTELVRWHQSWRGHALGLALVAALINLSYGAMNGSLIDGIQWSAFGAVAALALTGQANRLRNLAVTGGFCFGFIGPLVFGGLMAATAPQTVFTDDFSTNRGWIARDNATLYSRVENGAYTVQVKEPSFTFSVFPPAHFLQAKYEEAAFDAQIPEGAPISVGTYGVVCGYHQTGTDYLVEIDPIGEHYAFLQQDGEQIRPLNTGYWQPVTGTQISGGVTRVDVRCRSGKDGGMMTLAINGVAQGQIAAPGLQADGRTGIFVRTWPDSGPGGFKVLFDNVVFRGKE